MTAELLYEVLGDVNETYVEQAHAPRRKKAPAWVTWAAIAACATVVITACVPFLRPKGGPNQDVVPPLHMIENNGALYEVIDMKNRKLLDRYRLPYEITEDMVGSSLGYGRGDHGEKSEEWFLYTPYRDIFTNTWDGTRPQRAVYVVKTDGEYAFALFCNYISFDDNTHQEISELLAVYGIDEAADIACVEFDGKAMTDPAQIEVFFDVLNTSAAFGNADYQKLIFGGLSEAEQEELSTQLADSMISIRLTTQAGIVTTMMHYYPTIDYVYWSLNYYHLDSPLP